MNVTTGELDRILQQPGYSIMDGQLVYQHAQTRQKAAIGAQGSEPGEIISEHKSGPMWASERDFMAAVFHEIEREALLRPEYSLIYHVPNENSHRQPGVKGGVCDMCWPLPRRDATKFYGSCYVELKVGSNSLSERQKWWVDRLRYEGNFVDVVWDDLGKVMGLLDWYFTLDRW